MKKLYVVTMALTLTALAVDSGSAQARRRPSQNTYPSEYCCYGNRFTFDPYGGAMKDAFDVGADDDFGYLVGFRVGYQLAARGRLIGNVGYSYTENVSNPQGSASYYVYDNVWVITTAGAEFDVVPGRTAVSLGVQGGAAWRKLELEGSVGTPAGQPSNADAFTANETVVPNLTVRHWLGARTAVIVSLQDYMFDFLKGTTQHSPALTLGVSIR